MTGKCRSLLIGSLLCAVHPSIGSAQSDSVIHACYERHAGNLRVVGENVECRHDEAPLSWNTVGPEGPPASITAPLIVTGDVDPAPIQGINPGLPLESTSGIFGTGPIGVRGEGGAFGVVGRSALVTGVYGEGQLVGVRGRSRASASTGGIFVSDGLSGIGVLGESTASSIGGYGVGAIGRAPDAYSFAASRGGVGVRGEAFYGVSGQGHETLLPQAGAAQQGAGVRGEGYYGIYGTSANGFAGYFDGQVQVNGTFTATTIQQNSSRYVKTNILAVDPGTVLAKLASLPIQTWSYRDASSGARHLGPMAQDFFAAFGLGIDDEHIATVDESGVALVAIQALRTLILQKDARIDLLMERVGSLERQLDVIGARASGR